MVWLAETDPLDERVPCWLRAHFEHLRAKGVLFHPSIVRGHLAPSEDVSRCTHYAATCSFDFLRTRLVIYPFYKNAGRSWMDFLCWEALYLSQFVALEFFFRGFMLARLRSWAGHGAVFIMIIPYCMIHFPKTWSESVGAVIAGIVLGALALRGRSIWGGAFLHCCVALTMDVLSLHHSGKLQNLIGG